MTIAAIIPARFGSSRFPGKPLALIAGRPLIERVYARASLARLVDEVWVATDDERIAAVVRGVGGRTVMTSSAAASGTDRIAEALATVKADIVINVQGDEPLIDPRAIDLAAQALLDDPALEAATLSYPIASRAEFLRPDVVKVVVDAGGHALYFSRAPIPHGTPEGGPWGSKHLGLYAYRRELVAAFAGWARTPLESSESLEQLRLLEHGVRLRVLAAPSDSHAVDRPEDVAAVEAILEGTNDNKISPAR